ncbi:DNA-(apurinic or apyrimidinic site) lyase APN1 [Aspergillus fischeri NRRL 181]|uniref:Apurinic-apyrimidinic endonuclease 1 n=1 Tax=Neosartorya fischeri (strain ATCC 1020 / DSM 3700 / CBS 544.65 / FGSC A1164 / JCM 1740 / NRRL 181 / WB 181) TaxID=331117 RepID=A1DML1_NEOFI|nr:DNA (apurinic or apyrimidinic site) lyase, endon uclease [Aspergillus fischeri NRRL 181]EAW16032.1 DNA (apurinic or apyrimidinic site) lyase, endon uclease [Aspergillus fischeri NRRL 181]
MPPRSRNVTSNAVSESSPQSPRRSDPTKNKKRDIDELQEQGSPLRRSKRFKLTEALKASPAPGQLEIIDGPSAVDLRQKKPVVSPKKRKSQPRVSVKEEIEEEIEITVDTKVEKGSQAKPDNADETTTVTGKISRKRKTKRGKEIEMLPLRARTQGVRIGNSFALFLKSQRKWENPPLQDDHRDQFRQMCLEHKYDGAKHILPHGSYLVNLAQEDKVKAKQAYDSFLDDLRRCEALGITLYNFHPGSANQSSLPDALSRLAKALTNALEATSTVVPVLETMCGHGTTIGGYLPEFRDLLALIPREHHPRIGICIDTCHSFAAGYDLSSPAGYQSFMKEFEDQIGLQYLRALHLNDSKAPRGSKRDLHANIGTGFLGLRAFHNIMNDPRLEGLPMILETPIDRPANPTPSNVKDEPSDAEGDVDADSEPEAEQNRKKKTPKRSKSKPAGAKALVPDPSVWAREIALLESLIGMDPESPEFKTLETQLAEEGREVRAKHQEQYERKLAAEEKKKNKAAGGGKGQKTLMEMVQTSGKKRKGAKKRAESESENELESEDEGCQSH